MVDPQELRARVERSTRAQVEDILSHRPRVEWELSISIGYPAKEIQQIVQESQAGLLVAATHSRSGLERLLLGSVSRKLMSTLTVPLLIVPGALPAERLGQAGTIMIACDFSNEAESALSAGFEFARAFNAKLKLATVIEQSQLDQILTMDPQWDRAIANKLIDELSARLLDKIPGDLRETSETVVLAGHPHEELNKYAILNQVDIIVMGIHGRGFIENLMVGSTTDRLVRLGQFPVLAVRDPGRDK
jgi:nucleotide-binding universal stress UspA family protein